MTCGELLATGILAGVVILLPIAMSIAFSILEIADEWADGEGRFRQ